MRCATKRERNLFRPTWTRDGKHFTTKCWYCRFTDENGKLQKKPTGTPDIKAARLFLLAELKAVQERKQNRKLGIFVTDAADASISSLIDEWKKKKLALGKNADHVARVAARMTVMTKPFLQLGEITEKRVTEMLDELQPAPRHLDGKPGRPVEALSNRTVNRYRQALFMLFEWLVRADRWPRNPIRAVKLRDEDDPAVDRRPLVGDELPRLLKATEAVSTRRAAIYRLAANTGLRRSELLRLRNMDLDLKGERGIVTVPKAAAKSKKARHIPLSPSVTEALRAAHVGEGDPKGLAFPKGARGHKDAGVPRMGTFRSDLERAGITYTTAEGKIDFHALRTTFATDLVKAGVKLPKAQQLLGHSTPMLTMKYYAKLGVTDFDDDLATLEAFRAKAAATAEKATASKIVSLAPSVDLAG